MAVGEQTTYLNRIVKEADEHDIDLVTWWSHRDLLPSGISSTCNYQGLPWVWRVSMRLFQESFGCYLGDIVFKLWGTMGIRNYDGDPKEVYARWYAARKRPLMGESDTD